MNEHEAYRRRLAMKPNADLYLVPNQSNFMRPLHPDERKYSSVQAQVNSSARAAANFVSYEQELEAFRRSLEELKVLVAGWQLELALRRLGRKYSPDQPREPAGLREGGQWTNYIGGALSRTRLGGSAPLGDPRQEPRSNNIVLAQAQHGILLGQAIVHPTHGGGKDCFYQFSYGIVALRQSATFACPPTLPWWAATHGCLIK
jgi:hypothetical protein